MFSSLIGLFVHRKYSLTSTNYLETLDQLEIKLREIIEKIWILEKQTVDPSTGIDKIVRFQGELAQLYGDLDKFQVSSSVSLSPSLSLCLSTLGLLPSPLTSPSQRKLML
jgi:hypothetical protein